MARHTSGDARITPLVCPDPKKEEAVESQTPAETSALRELIQQLQRDLDYARAMEARLFHLLEQRPLVAPSPQALLPQGTLTMRKRIFQVLEKHRGWMHRKQIEEAVQSDKLLGNTLQKMAKAGLIISNGRGSYGLSSVLDSTSTQ